MVAGPQHVPWCSPNRPAAVNHLCWQHYMTAMEDNFHGRNRPISSGQSFAPFVQDPAVLIVWHQNCPEAPNLRSTCILLGKGMAPPRQATEATGGQLVWLHSFVNRSSIVRTLADPLLEPGGAAPPESPLIGGKLGVVQGREQAGPGAIWGSSGGGS